jgi:putative methionine-R-sulfoxide reductase with GAF domain
VSTSEHEQLRRLEAVADAQLAHLDHDELVAELLDRIRELIGVDTVVVLVVDQENQQLVAHASRGLEEEVRRGVRVPIGRGFAGRVASERAPVILDHVGPDVVLNPLLWRKGIKTLLGVPLVVAGDLVGVMHVGSLTDRQFSSADVDVVQAAADRVATTIQGAAAAADRSAAKILQRGLVPPRLPSIPDVELAGGFIPAAAFGVGGDWYDAFALPDGRVGIAIGDVVGSGLRAALVMSRMRSVLRAYAVELDSPADVLSRLDRTMSHFEPNEMATVGYGIVDFATASLTFASAGHPPPVVAVPERPAELVELRPGPPICSRLANTPVDSTIDLAPGATLIVYTDGLVERRGESITDGLERLRDVFYAGEPDQVCHTVVEALIGSAEQATDDTALLIARISLPGDG